MIIKGSDFSGISHFVAPVSCCAHAQTYNTALVEKVLTFCDVLCTYFRSHDRHWVSGTPHKQARVAA
jgi:hypothetical protein